MKKEKFEAIKRRAEKATPGPWRANSFGEIWSATCHLCNFEIECADTDFVAHARIDVPALIAEVESLNKKLEKLLETNIHLVRELDKALGDM